MDDTYGKKFSPIRELELYVTDKGTAKVDFFNDEGALLIHEGKDISLTKIKRHSLYVRKKDFLEEIVKEKQEEYTVPPEERIVKALKKEPRKVLIDVGIVEKAFDTHKELRQLTTSLFSRKSFGIEDYDQAEDIFREMLKTDISTQVYHCINILRGIEDDVTLAHSEATAIKFWYVIDDLRKTAFEEGVAKSKASKSIWNEFESRPRISLNPADRLNYTIGGFLHDVGKAGIPSEVLNKPGKLNDKEREIIREHPRIGYEELKSIGINNMHLLDIVGNHHPDYPISKPGFMAQIFAIIDQSDSMMAKRPYKEPFSPKKTFIILTETRERYRWNPYAYKIAVNRILSFQTVAEEYGMRLSGL